MDTKTVAASGSVGGSLAYLAVAVPTEWLQIVPLVPEQHFLPVVGALGVVLSAVLLLIFPKKEGAS